MTTRAELKSRAKQCLSRYYWWAFLACMLAGILGGGSGGGIQMGAGAPNISFNFTKNVSLGGAEGHSAVNGFSRMNLLYILTFLTVFLIAVMIGLVIGAAFSAFVGNVVRVGSCRYFMESREQMQSAGIGRLFYAFESGRYLNTVKVMFMRSLFVLLWYLALIVPGVIKSYEYCLVPYILQDNPGIYYKDALNLSKEMMYGNKWRLFVLQWSFIGWKLLTLLTCGIGQIFLTPYEEAVYAEFYADLRGNFVRTDETWQEEQVVC